MGHGCDVELSNASRVIAFESDLPFDCFFYFAVRGGGVYL